MSTQIKGINRLNRMLTTLLLIVIIISCKTFTKGFTKGFTKRFIKLNHRPLLTSFSKTKLNLRITSTSFYEDEDENDKRKKKDYYSDFISDSDLNFVKREEQVVLPNNEKIYNEELDNEPLYTLVWYDCEDCRKLLNDLKNERKKILYIDGSYYFFDEEDETNEPIFYKNDELIATDVFGIYEELFYDKVIEE